jgi:hypothetical protein
MWNGDIICVECKFCDRNLERMRRDDGIVLSSSPFPPVQDSSLPSDLPVDDVSPAGLLIERRQVDIRRKAGVVCLEI